MKSRFSAFRLTKLFRQTFLVSAVTSYNKMTMAGVFDLELNDAGFGNDGNVDEDDDDVVEMSEVGIFLICFTNAVN